MLETILVNLVVLAFALGGLALWWMGLNALRVLLFSPFWPRVEAQVRGRVEVSHSKRYIENTNDYRPSAGDSLSHQAFGGGEVTSRTYSPVLTLHYQYRGHTYQADNSDFWNHRSGYTEAEARACVTEAPKKPWTIRINPARPQEVFLGAGHFPWVFTPVFLLVGGLMATGAVGALLDDLAELFKLSLPLIGDRTPFILVVPALSVLWWVWEMGFSLLYRPAGDVAAQTQNK
jgi:hypothetical protein